LDWPDKIDPEPDPFTEDERDWWQWLASLRSFRNFLSCGGKWEDAAHEWIFAVRAYQQAARRVHQPATFP
jgi:hypothetical protein